MNVFVTKNKCANSLIFCIVMFLCILTSGCISDNINSVNTDYQPSMEAFVSEIDANNNINGYWLGIKPVTTTREEALRIIDASPWVVHSSVDRWGEITLEWHTEINFRVQGRVRLKSDENENISEITLSFLFPFTVRDIIEIYGTPDEISIGKAYEKTHQEELISYSFYYLDQKVVMVISSSHGGIHPDDIVDWLRYATNLPKKSIRIPWQGYGSYEDYTED